MWYIGVITNLLTIDPNFLGHPSRARRGLLSRLFFVLLPGGFVSLQLYPRRKVAPGFRFAENHVEKRHGKLA